mgnify:CR=1 FL=1
MDLNPLSTTIGHVSGSTSLNIYAHGTDGMQRTAAANIDQGIGKGFENRSGSRSRKTRPQHLSAS